MNEITMIAFKTDGPEADKQFIEEYVLDLVERTSEMDEWERVGYARSGQGPIDGGQVSVFFEGDPKTVISAEADRWDELISAGFADEWTHERGPESRRNGSSPRRAGCPITYPTNRSRGEIVATYA